MRSTEQKEQMLEHVGRWQSSGLSQAAYARQEEINLHTFRYWIKKQQLELQPFDGFIRLGQTPPAEISLRYPNGVELYLPMQTPAKTILELVKA
jgi:hypothetical protein